MYTDGVVRYVRMGTCGEVIYVRMSKDGYVWVSIVQFDN